MRQEGKIKWFSMKKGYGFLESQGRDYFVHKSNIEKQTELEKGDKVSFKPHESSKGAFVIKVRKIPDHTQKEPHRGANSGLSQEE